MRMSYKRPMAMLLATMVAVVSAGSVSTTVNAETTLERLQKAKAEREKTQDAKEDTEDRCDKCWAMCIF